MRKNLWKKLMAAVVIGMLVCGTFAGCGSKEQQAETSETAETVETEEETQEEAAEVETADAAETTEASEYQTYEFETYDGDTVVIDDSNIVSQEACDDVLAWEDLPEDAEQLAPGRDYILFADADNYYVEDAANGLLTVATK